MNNSTIKSTTFPYIRQHLVFFLSRVFVLFFLSCLIFFFHLKSDEKINILRDRISRVCKVMSMGCLNTSFLDPTVGY